MNEPRQITVPFNIALFIFCALQGLVSFGLSNKTVGVSFEGLVLTSFLDLLRFTIVMFITAYFVREIWNRLISTVFHVRNLNAAESITLILLASLLSS